MNQTVIEQIGQAIQNAQTVLITTPAYRDADALGSVLALQQAITKMDKEKKVTAIIPKAAPQKLQFLPGSDQLITSMERLQKTVITVPAEKPIEKLMYDKQETGEVKIYLTPAGQSIDTEDLHIEKAASKPEVIISVGGNRFKDLAFLKPVFENTEENPKIINITASKETKNFANLNLQGENDNTHTELTLALLKTLDKNLIARNTATNLLAGIISATENFRSHKTTSDNFLHAGELLQKSAAQQKIIHNLYGTKDLRGLKLWARCLDQLEEGEDGQIVWSHITKNDFAAADAQRKHLSTALDELAAHYPSAKASFLVWQEENNNHPKGLLYLRPRANHIRPTLVEQFNAKDLGDKLLFQAPYSQNHNSQDDPLALTARRVYELIKSAM